MAKGTKTGGGTRKGKPNKLTADLRQAIQEAFTKAGGVTYLTKVAEDSPAVFCKLLGMTLPKDVNVTATVSLDQMLVEAARRRQM